MPPYALLLLLTACIVGMEGHLARHFEACAWMTKGRGKRLLAVTPFNDCMYSPIRTRDIRHALDRTGASTNLTTLTKTGATSYITREASSTWRNLTSFASPKKGRDNVTIPALDPEKKLEYDRAGKKLLKFASLYLFLLSFLMTVLLLLQLTLINRLRERTKEMEESSKPKLYLEGARTAYRLRLLDASTPRVLFEKSLTPVPPIRRKSHSTQSGSPQKTKDLSEFYEKRSKTHRLA